jgi:hypothetical protein
VYLGSVMKKNGKIQNEINERIGKVSEFYLKTKSLLWNKDVDKKCKITKYNVYFKKMILYGAETWECTERGK